MITNQLGITTLQRAFVESRSVTANTPLGLMILQTAQKQIKEAEMLLKLEGDIQKAQKDAIKTMFRREGEKLGQYLLRLDEVKAQIRVDLTTKHYNEV